MADREDDLDVLEAETRKGLAGICSTYDFAGNEAKLERILRVIARTRLAEATNAEREAAIHAEILSMRGVRYAEDVCKACNGLGAAMYPSTSGWRGGVGGAAMTYDVCDKCWGSGDVHNPGVDLRKALAERDSWEAGQAVEYLARVLQADFESTRGYLSKLADLAQGQANKRKLPEGADAFWWGHNWRMLASCLRDLVKRAPKVPRG